MLTVSIDEQYVREEIHQQVKKAIDSNNQELVLWDTNELKRRTCMCWNTIQDKFLHNPDFPKYKVGSKWYFPAKECEEFILNWIRRQ